MPDPRLDEASIGVPQGDVPRFQGRRPGSHVFKFPSDLALSAPSSDWS